MKGLDTLPLMEPIFTMRPRAFLRSVRNAWVTASCPKTFTSNCCRILSRGRNSSGPATTMPALFTRPARPAPSTIFVTVPAADVIVGASVTSIRSGVIRPDDSRFRCSPSESFRTPAKTRNPRLSRWSAVVFPMPVDAPVMTTAPGDGFSSCGMLSPPYEETASPLIDCSRP